MARDERNSMLFSYWSAVDRRTPARLLLALLLVLVHQMSKAQETIHVSVPTNTTCATAIPFCGDLTFTYDIAFTGCLWFVFTLSETDSVCLTTEGAKANHIPATAVDACACLTTGSNLNIAQSLSAGMHYIVFQATIDHHPTLEIDVTCGLTCATMDCNGCLPSFMPLANEWYIVSGWVKQEGAALDDVNYGEPSPSSPHLRVEAPEGTMVEDAYPTSDVPVIEGWQLIEKKFQMPAGATTFAVRLLVGAGTALFDDVRIFPADGSMKSYVYDAENLRFVAELDERHFATFYEYDNEGKVVRVKKETERGIMTIQETRQNAAHTP